MSSLHKNIFDAYIQTTLWSSTDDSDIPLDSNYSKSDLDTSTLSQMQSDLDAFFSNVDLIEQANEYKDDNQIAHDFWLTRNYHGAGFWDGGYSDDGIGSGILGDALTKLARSFPQQDLYVGDDGKLYI